MSEYEHLRADVPKRRTGYKLFMVSVAVVFLVSLADMIWLDDLLFYGVIGAYILLFVWAFVLLFSRRLGQHVRVGEVVLKCPSCSNAFLYGSTHLDDPHGTMISCPMCSHSSTLPESGREPKPVVLPTTEPIEAAYGCNSCEETVVIATFGQAPRSVKFAACPHCQERGTLFETGNVKAERQRKANWQAQ